MALNFHRHEISFVCVKCGEELKVVTTNGVDEARIAPCEKCFKMAEGTFYQVGFEDGYNEGRRTNG